MLLLLSHQPTFSEKLPAYRKACVTAFIKLFSLLATREIPALQAMHFSTSLSVLIARSVRVKRGCRLLSRRLALDEVVRAGACPP